MKLWITDVFKRLVHVNRQPETQTLRLKWRETKPSHLRSWNRNFIDASVNQLLQDCFSSVCEPHAVVLLAWSESCRSLMRPLVVCSADLHHVPVDDPSCQPARLHHHWNLGCVSETNFLVFLLNICRQTVLYKVLQVSVCPPGIPAASRMTSAGCTEFLNVLPFLEGESVYSAVVVRRRVILEIPLWSVCPWFCVFVPPAVTSAAQRQPLTARGSRAADCVQHPTGGGETASVRVIQQKESGQIDLKNTQICS